MLINFISSKDVDEEHVMHTKSDNTKIMTYDEVNEVIEELFQSLFFEISNRIRSIDESSDFIFD